MNTAAIFSMATKVALLHGMIAVANPNAAPVQIRVNGGKYKTIAYCYVRTEQEVKACGDTALSLIFNLGRKVHANICLAEPMIADRLNSFDAANKEANRITLAADKLRRHR